MIEPQPFRFPGVTFAAIRKELARELAHRRKVYRDWLTKGSITQKEADWQLAVMEAIGKDAARFETCHAALPMANPLTLPRGHDFSWRERRGALLRELDYRARLYPEWIRKGRLTSADADRHCQCLETMLALYEDELDWTPANGTPPAYGSITPTADQIASRAEWAATAAEIHARQHPEKQKEMAL